MPVQESERNRISTKPVLLGFGIAVTNYFFQDSFPSVVRDISHHHSNDFIIPWTAYNVLRFLRFSEIKVATLIFAASMAEQVGKVTGIYQRFVDSNAKFEFGDVVAISAAMVFAVVLDKATQKKLPVSS